MEQLKLKPCPFCGGRARVIGKRRSGSACYCISCSSCGAKSRAAFVQPWHDSKFVAQCQAAKLWNARADNDADATKVPALFAFIQQEVPFRLENIFNIPSEKITPNIVDVCVWSLYDNSDVMFDYDSMDDHLRELLKEYDIDPDDYEEEEEKGKD